MIKKWLKKWFIGDPVALARILFCDTTGKVIFVYYPTDTQSEILRSGRVECAWVQVMGMKGSILLRTDEMRFSNNRAVDTFLNAGNVIKWNAPLEFCGTNHTPPSETWDL